MMKKLKSIYIAVITVFLYLLHLPFALAKSAAGTKWLHDSFNTKIPTTNSDLPIRDADRKSVYDSLHLDLAGLNRKAFDYAKKGLLKLKEQGRIINDSILSIVDFSQPSSNRRFYVLDLKNYRILFNTFVAHGRNSGKEWANSFSNSPRSHKSSLGFYITGEPYDGRKGYSLKLEGLESGINDKAYDRAIVIHGANYVSQSFINEQGFIGRSEGCPAVPVNDAEPIIDLIKDGSCLFIYSPGQNYSHHSTILN
jgi:hypothetical protein